MKKSDQEIRFELAERIVKLFWPERIVYLGLSGITAIIVIFEVVFSLHNQTLNLSTGWTLLGSGGVVTFNLAQLLRMFNTVILKVFGPDSASGATDGH
jgi:hypothetical protein